ncbi:hypothetical protein [Nocardia asiatica]|uniref:hypothetical protein n=1 Tax=Nocardia asiatica TaxID=209252 RepID=UPI002458469D|nr:hypothetical protein [Nocardia asiatica]
MDGRPLHEGDVGVLAYPFDVGAHRAHRFGELFALFTLHHSLRLPVGSCHGHRPQPGRLERTHLPQQSLGRSHHVGRGRVGELVVAEFDCVVVAYVSHHAVDLDFHRPQPRLRRSLCGAFVAAAQRFSVLADTLFGRDAAGAPPTACAAVLGHVSSGSGTGAHATLPTTSQHADKG